MKLPLKLLKKLERRGQENALRELPELSNLVDFSSNDYLGFAASREILDRTSQILKKSEMLLNGATGSRLLSGNHNLYGLAEEKIAIFHNAEAALIFNSGYDANIGFFSSVPQRGDLIFYDELVHASIRDGILLSNAKSFKFLHNDVENLREQVARQDRTTGDLNIYIVTESVFSMDGDLAPLKEIAGFAENFKCYLIVDEAHATGVLGPNGRGLVQELNLENRVFARLHTFGKGLGCHGAAILGSKELKKYLVNFARSLIYTTGLPPHSVATVLGVYENLATSTIAMERLRENIQTFRKEIKRLKLDTVFIKSTSAIQSCILPGNVRVKKIASLLKEAGYEVKPILSPTVPPGSERLRFCLHSFNSEAEIKEVLKLLVTFINEK